MSSRSMGCLGGTVGGIVALMIGYLAIGVLYGLLHVTGFDQGSAFAVVFGVGGLLGVFGFTVVGAVWGARAPYACLHLVGRLCTGALLGALTGVIPAIL